MFKEKGYKINMDFMILFIFNTYMI